MQPHLRVPTLPLLALGLLAAACTAPPTKPTLRFHAADASGWSAGPAGVLRAQCGGATVSVNLDSEIVRLEVLVENPTDRALEVKLGAQGGKPSGAIGEVRRRPLGNPRAEDVPPVTPYLSHTAVVVRPRWAATFELDSLLGREPTLGQYAVLEVEVLESGRPSGERRILPLQATNVAPAGWQQDR